MQETKVIPFEGNYWWGDSKNVVTVLEEELRKVLSGTRISSIKIHGSDFYDGRENHEVTIAVSDNKITVRKNCS